MKRITVILISGLISVSRASTISSCSHINDGVTLDDKGVYTSISHSIPLSFDSDSIDLEKNESILIAKNNIISLLGIYR
jgi:hypothetical protein